MLNRETVSPCGLYCGVCGIYQATINKDDVLRQKFAKAYGVTFEELACLGCLSNNIFKYCKICEIKACTAKREIEGCYQCSEFPCGKVEAFPVSEGKKNILRAVPRWRELGTEMWVEEEEKLFTCQSCGKQLFRGAKKCRNCETLVG
jgi:predicted RNA-binding Zn-ribbon protein involved in translation (DUF1610 family)